MLHVRTNTDPRGLIAPLRDAIRSVDAAVPVFDAKTMEDQMLVALLPARLAGTLLGAFGMLALLLATVGICGVMATRLRSGRERSVSGWPLALARVSCWR